MAEIDLNPQFEKALASLQDPSKHVFITGQAGTGKSTLLSHFVENSDLNYAVVAPTGVAALNVGGQTIHSFFGFWPDISLEEVKRQARFKKKKGEIYQALDVLVIDEISMVRADLLDAVDLFLRVIREDDRPFGGVKFISFGDLQQLSPVVRRDEFEQLSMLYASPYFFDSFVFTDLMAAESDNFETIELIKHYRQTDEDFIKLLAAIRSKKISDQQLSDLNQKVVKNIDLEQLPGSTIMLTTTNFIADQVNNKRLDNLDSRPIKFKAKVTGKFEKNIFPTDQNIIIKPGARVMMINNDQDDRWVNGSTGEVQELITNQFNPTRQGVLVKLDGGELVEVWPHTFEMNRSYFNPGQNKIEREVVGTFTQLPLKLAWAVTIHKSQGKTFDNVMVDFGRGTFAPGQTYVALSRCTSLEGLSLVRPLKHEDIKLDPIVSKFLDKIRN